MQSDDRVKTALAALKPGISQYRFVVSSTLDRAQALLGAELSPVNAGSSLGEFALGRIDPARFAQISKGSVPIDTVGRAMLERCIDVLQSLLDAGDELYVVNVAAGGSLTDAIRSRIARIGTAFGAAGIVELVRRRSYDPGSHGLPSDEQSFDKWTASERRLSPPLIVRVKGDDFDPTDLPGLIDGSIQIVFLVDGAASVAPLARVISPGVFVAQAADLAVLDALRNLDGPAVIAVMTGNEARFAHDPRAGWASWQRLKITFAPESNIRKSSGKRSAWQQREDLAHLKSLADLPALNAKQSARPIATPAEPAERIAAWLLEQTA